jgi:hypothetical protein
MPRNASWNPSPDVYARAAYFSAYARFSSTVLAMTFGTLPAATPI